MLKNILNTIINILHVSIKLSNKKYYIPLIISKNIMSFTWCFSFSFVHHTFFNQFAAISFFLNKKQRLFVNEKEQNVLKSSLISKY